MALRVSIISARGLRAADWTLTGGKSDPYCICEIPDKPHSKFQTEVIAKTLQPTWNYEGVLAGFVAGDSIQFSVYDKDWGKSDDFLGRLTLTSDLFYPHGFDGELPLEEPGRRAKAHLRVRIAPLELPGGSHRPSRGSGPQAGGIWACPACTLENKAEDAQCSACEGPRPALQLPGVRPAAAVTEQRQPSPPDTSPQSTRRSQHRAPSVHESPGGATGHPQPRNTPTAAGQPQRLRVELLSARGLRNADWLGKSDPYCVCEVPGRERTKFQTQVIENTLSPVWNYTGEITEYFTGESLLITVYDKDWGKTDDVLGKLSLTSNQFLPSGFEGELPLSETGGRNRSYLKLKITPAGVMQRPGEARWESPDADGFQIFRQKDALPGRNAFEMPASDIALCKRICRERRFGGFVVYRGTAYFRRESPAECLANLAEGQESVSYIDTAATATSPRTPSTRLHMPVPGSLGITILSATGLRAADWGGKSDPFCVCEIPGKPQSRFQTQVLHQTVEPIWNHHAQIADYSPGDSLLVTVYDQDWGKADDILGRVTLTTDQFHPGGFEGSLPLTEAGRGHASFLRIRVDPAVPGQPQPLPAAVSPSPATQPGGVLKLTILSARGLRAAEWGWPFALSSSEPYCVCEVPGKPQSRLQTRTVGKTLEPHWNHEAQVSYYTMGDSLTFAVFHKNARNGDELLGRATLAGSQLQGGAPFEAELPLSEAGRGAHAYLRVRAVLVGAALSPLLPDSSIAPVPIQAPPGSTEIPIRVAIMSARGLRNANWVTNSDAYCICEIPGKPYSKVQTPVVKDSLDPVWNHESRVPEYASGDTLEFTVWDKNVIGADGLLGRAFLTSHQFRSSGFEGEIPLSEAGNVGAYLRVKVVVPPGVLAQQGWHHPVSAVAANSCNLLGMTFAILCGVPLGLPSDGKLANATKAPPELITRKTMPALPSSGRWQAPRGGEEQQTGQAGLQLATVLDTLGMAYQDAGNFQEALANSKKALNIRIDGLGTDHPDTAASYQRIGTALRLQNRLEEAWQFHWKALEIRLLAYGDYHVDSAASYTCLGAVLLQQGDLDNALEHYLRALEISRTMYGEEHLDTAACYNDVGAVFETKGELAKALLYLSKALDVQRQLSGDWHPSVGDAHNNVGAVLWQAGRLDEALEHHRRAMEIRLQVLGNQHPDTALSYGNVGVILERQGRCAEALEHQHRALEIRMVALGDQHSETAASHINLGIVLEKMLRLEEAWVHYKKAHTVLQATLGWRHAWTEQAKKHIHRCGLARNWVTAH